MGGRVLLFDDPEYPPSLRVIPDAPPVLFVQGGLSLLDPPAVAIVGSRDHTAYGGEVGRKLAWGAASAGLVVVSGMARGLDAVAHSAALDAGGGTIGVMGNGLGVVYPAANRRLYSRVERRGLLLTEFPPGERPSAGSFPRRNRLISGLARVTVVVEAARGSGALITAGTALDQGREVMAVPGNITSPTSTGANELIRDGATPLLTIEDLLRHYPEAVQPAVGTGSAGQDSAAGPSSGLRACGRRAPGSRAGDAGGSGGPVGARSAGVAVGVVRLGDRGGGREGGAGVQESVTGVEISRARRNKLQK